MEITKEEATIMLKALNLYFLELRNAKKKSKKGMPIYDMADGQLIEAQPIYEKLMLG